MGQSIRCCQDLQYIPINSIAGSNSFTKFDRQTPFNWANSVIERQWLTRRVKSILRQC